MVQPRVFKVHEKEHQVYRLRKALYGLQQALRTWYSNIDSFFQQHGLLRSNFDHNLYFNIFMEGFYTILILYLDDVLLTKDDISKLLKIEEELK